MTDPYSVLGISPGADDETLKKAYRQKCKQYHPDLHPDDPAAEEHFKEVQAAYSEIMRRKQGGGQSYSQGSTGSYTRQSGYGYQERSGELYPQRLLRGSPEHPERHFRRRAHGAVALLCRLGASGLGQQHPRAGGSPHGGFDAAQQLRLPEPAGSIAAPGARLRRLPAALRPAQRHAGAVLPVVLDVPFAL